MIWELVLTIMLHGEPREIDWRSLERQQSCEEQAQWLNARAGFSSYHGAKAFCREVPRRPSIAIYNGRSTEALTSSAG